MFEAAKAVNGAKTANAGFPDTRRCRPGFMGSWKALSLNGRPWGPPVPTSRLLSIVLLYILPLVVVDTLAILCNIIKRTDHTRFGDEYAPQHYNDRNQVNSY